jgi:hypothetical protein
VLLIFNHNNSFGFFFSFLDVVEMFIAPDLGSNVAIHNYLELELSPNGVLFAANVTNPQLTCSVCGMK